MIDFMAMDPDAVVEPWQPKVGDRVRVRLSAECNLKWSTVGLSSGRDYGAQRHAPEVDGVVGSVVEQPAFTNAPPGHPYPVRYDKPLWVGFNHVAGGNYAASELEPLS